ncbi:MAG: M15 family metallopeptidase [Acidobacteriota bacterium]|nr:M15 family metallopeptidase [Acidobacteriota bacterium]
MKTEFLKPRVSTVTGRERHWQLLRSLPLAVLILFSLAQAQSISEPPKETGKFRQADLVELIKLDPTIKLDIRYAASNNFLGKPVYKEARAFLQRPAAEALARINQRLRKKGYGLLVFDGYRPWAVTKLFWDSTPDDKKKFVANPSQGSRHNRGCAVDLSLFDLKTGKEIEMPSGYDEMTDRAYPNYKGGTAEQRGLRDLLRAEMEADGFTVFDIEWWHFDFNNWREYPILNIPFDQIKSPGKKN